MLQKPQDTDKTVKKVHRHMLLYKQRLNLKYVILSCCSESFALLSGSVRMPALPQRPVSPVPSLCYVHQAWKEGIKRGGGPHFWKRGTFLSNGLTTGSKRVHKLDIAEEFFSFWPIVFFLVPLLSVFWEPFPVLFSLHSEHVCTRISVCPPFSASPDPFRSGFDLHENQPRKGPLPFFLPLSHHSFIPDCSHLCSFLA